MMSLLTAGFFQIFLIKFLNLGILVSLANRLGNVLVVECFGAGGADINGSPGGRTDVRLAAATSVLELTVWDIDNWAIGDKFVLIGSNFGILGDFSRVELNLDG